MLNLLKRYVISTRQPVESYCKRVYVTRFSQDKRHHGHGWSMFSHQFIVKSQLFQVRKLSNNLSEMKVEQMVGNLKLKEPGNILLKM